MADDKKKLRGQKKGIVTRHLNTLEQHIADEDIDALKSRLDLLKIAFTNFETVHDDYHNSLETEDEERESEKYFFDLQNTYIESVKAARGWLKQQLPPSQEVKPDLTRSPEASSAKETSMMVAKSADLLSFIHLPKVEIEKFDGDPMKFHCFIKLFDECVKMVDDDTAKLTRLLQYTSGKAYSAICSCILMEDGYERARKILTERFGDNFLVAERLVSSIRKGKPIKTAEELRELSDDINNCYQTMIQIGCKHEIDNQNCIVEVVSRLKNYIQNRWKRRVMDIKRTRDAYPTFEDLVKFLNEESQEANDPIYGSMTSKHGPTRQQSHKSPTSTVFSSDVNNTKTVHKIACIVCKDEHKLFGCPTFKAMSPPERLQVVVRNKLCENCLLGNHSTQNCRKPGTCSVPGCGKRHTKFIHINQRSTRRGDEASSNETVQLVNANVSTSDKVYMPVVAVTVNNQRQVCALLDTGSSNSFCSRSLITSLGVECNDICYSLSTLSGQENVKSSCVNLVLTSLDGKESMNISNVYVIDNIPVLTSNVKCGQYPHLNGIQVVAGGQKVQLLIGQDNAEALVPLEIRRGKKGDPFASRTVFGWTINGSNYVTDLVGKSVQSHFISAMPKDTNINQLWEMESDDICSEKLGLSPNDNKVLNLWHEQIKVVNGHYELPIPWKDNAELQNNYGVAASRLNGLVKNLEKKGLMDRYKVEMNKLLEEGYAEKVPECELCLVDNIWFLPHHAVVSEKKPDKVRIVFDCAARFKGQSLNDKCLQGPDLNNKLLHVLLRFRQHEYALMADIIAMYYQVLIPERDRNALRFLWYDDEGNLVQYRMTRHIFGGIWCASSSTFALRQTTLNCPDILVSDTIQRSFYVDDLLRSAETQEEISMIISGTRDVLAKFGFHLSKFVVNDVGLLSLIPEVDQASEVKDLNFDSRSKVLGVGWNIIDDEFLFDVKVKFDHEITKRSMLSFVASMYDPLGLICPFVVAGKIMFREAVKLSCWDDPIPPDLTRKWFDWIDSLEGLSGFRIPRCIKPKLFNDAALELHVFSDASEEAYGSCCYLRAANGKGDINTVLLLAKCRVAPQKSLSIPRLELQAAVLSTQLELVLRRELDLDLLPTYFWTDSEVVIKYISNESRRFQVFVANRVGIIRRSTQPKQWHHVSGSDNPADLLTRAQDSSSLDVKLWSEGPEFLKKHKSEWKSHTTDLYLPEDHPELKQKRVDHVSNFFVTTSDHPLERLMEYYSDWSRLRRAVAWLIRLKTKLAKKGSQFVGPELYVEEIRTAEKHILKFVQGQSFEKEIVSLSNDRSVPNSSPIKDLSPFLDDDGLLRVGGRLKNAKIDIDKQHPVIISHSHRIASLISFHFHNLAHLGLEWVVSSIREKFWITRIRTVVKKIAFSCIVCKRLFASNSSQRMADLPAERLEHGKPPFSYVGIDCFGPIVVKRGRSDVKRYGCVFTCFSTRAVHLEKLDSLDTESFLNGFRRFISRRGIPIRVWSDRATNFVGCKAELSKSQSQIDCDKLLRYSSMANIEWTFNPPGASHMGGVWERMIRTVRKVMNGLLPQSYRLSDECLSTLLCEVEMIINSRPITKVSNDINDASPLTPNHLLLFRSLPSIPPGMFTEADLYRKRWRSIQYLASLFWKRWLREYIPNLQHRTKWHEKVKNIEIGDLVLITEENVPRGVWPMGLVLETNKSKDGLVRSVVLKTKCSTLTRPISKLVLLESKVL